MASHSDVELRRPREAEFDLIGRAWASAVPHDPTETWGVTLRDVVFPPDQQGHASVLEERGQVVGFCSVRNGALWSIYVDEARRRCGLGTLLLQDAIEFGKANRWSRLEPRTPCHWVGSVVGINLKNESAVPFLEHHGFSGDEIVSHMEADFEDLHGARLKNLPSRVELRTYAPSHLEEMRKFVKRLKLKQWVWDNWEQMYSDEDDRRVRIVALDGQEIIGCVDVLISPIGIAGVNYISVLHARRHEGVGSHLLRAAAEEAERRGATSMFAGDVVVQDFYLSSGWRVQHDFKRLSLRLPKARAKRRTRE